MMRARRTTSILLSVLIGLIMLGSAGRTLGQNADPTPQPPGIGEIGAAIGQSIGSMFSALTTPYQPPITLDIYAGIQQTRGSDGAFILGDPDAPITLVEFADWGCPHCDTYKPVIDQFIDTYVRTGQAAFEFRILPTAGGQLTVFAGQLAECADYQRPGAFWAVSELLYDLALKGQYTQEAILKIPARLNLDTPTLQSCIGSVPQVTIDGEYATLLNVGGTPAVLIRHGDETPTFIRRGNTTYDSGGVPFDILQFIMEGGSSGGQTV